MFDILEKIDNAVGGFLRGQLTVSFLVGGIFVAIQAIEGMVLQPRILGKGAGLHPLAIMLALAAGSWFGITGMIAAVPVARIIRVLLIEFDWTPLQQNAENAQLA